MGEGGAQRGPARRVEETSEGGEGGQNFAERFQQDSSRQSGGKEVEGEGKKDDAEENVLILRSAQARASRRMATDEEVGASWFETREMRSSP